MQRKMKIRFQESHWRTAPIPVMTSFTSLSSKNCCLCAYLCLVKYGLYCSSYSTLTIAYKFLLTLSCTQVCCERSYSILKFIKSRLRSTLSADNLEAYMLMCMEKRVLMELDNKAIVDAFGQSSKELARLLF